MQISTQIELTSDEKKELAKILNCKVGELPEKLALYSTAALKEITSMILGQKVFNRGSDLLEYRLLLLILHVFDGKIPDEQDVCKLFQTTSSGSRALLRAVMSKYQYLLKAGIRDTLVQLLENGDFATDGGDFIVSVHNLNLVEEFNLMLSQIDTNLSPVQKKRGSVSTFEISPSSYNALCEFLGIQPKTQDTDED